MNRMSSESDSEVFFDAEDNTPIKTTKTTRAEEKPESEKDNSTSQCEVPSISDNSISITTILPNEDDLKEAARKAKDNEKRRKKVEELRKLMLHDDDDAPESQSDQSSFASSSVEAIYPRNTSLYPHIHSDKSSQDATSMLSLGKVGHILGDRDAVSIDSQFSMSDAGSYRGFVNAAGRPGSEPDVVASTKNDQMLQPVAPPRKKKRNKNNGAVGNSKSNSSSNSELPSPTDPVESLARELEYSLDLHSATRGQYVVKPQDREQDRTEGPITEGSAAQTIFALRSDSLKCTSSRASQHGVEASDIGKLPTDDVKPQPFMVRTRSDSGRPLTDQEILAQVTVRNLDTGEQIPLSLAEEHLPKCLNPLSLHIMRLTSEYVSNPSIDKESDEESVDMRKSESMEIGATAWERTRGLRKRLKAEVIKIKTTLDRVTHSKHGEDDNNSEEEILSDQRSAVKIKLSSKLKSSEKNASEFEAIKVLQELSGEHSGAIWTMKFSACGRLLATAGQDHDLRIWVLKDAYNFFSDMRRKYNTENKDKSEGKSSPAPCQPDICVDNEDKVELDVTEDDKEPFVSKPFCRYVGHTAELLDVSWSKNYFILSSSMDKTVRLWHISRKECLCCFQHIDFVTAIAFHPRDDRYFLSGSLDGKLRLWNIPDKKVTLWNELDGQTKLITAVNFCQNGKIAIVGTYDGHCIFYYTEQLKYYTQIHVKSTKGKNARGRKISGIEAMPGEDKILVTSNDSRIRLYDLRDLCLTCKYKGYVNLSSQIKASFSHDGKYIISGSENQFIYLWKTAHDCTKFRRDRNDYWTGIKAHNALVTSAVFAPNPSLIVKQLEADSQKDKDTSSVEHSINNYVMVSADYHGVVKVFLHKVKPGVSNSS